MPAEYINTYVLVPQGVQMGGAMSSFFGLIRASGRLMRTDSPPKNLFQVIYPPYPDYIMQRFRGWQVLGMVRAKTGFDNPYVNSIYDRVNEWNSSNPSKLATSTFGDEVRPPAATQEQIDQAIAATINSALDAAWGDFINTFTDEYLRMVEFGMILYFLTEDYEAAVANAQYEANTLSQSLPYATEVKPPPEQIPLNIKFTPIIQRMEQRRAAEMFANIYCRALQEASTGTVRIGDTVCLTAKNAAAERDVYNLVDAHNAKADPGFLAAITYDTYCEGVSKMCGSEVTYIPYEEDYMGDDEDTGGQKDPMFY